MWKLFDVRDVVAGVGLVLIAGGLAWYSAAVAAIVVGAILLLLAQPPRTPPAEET